MNILEKAAVFEKMAAQRLLRVNAQQTPAEPNMTPTDPTAAQSVDPGNVNVDTGFRPTPSGHEETGAAKTQNPAQDAAHEKQITESVINESKQILTGLANANMQALTQAQKAQLDRFMKILYPALMWRRNWLSKGGLGGKDQDSIALMSEINGIVSGNDNTPVGRAFYNITNGYKNMGTGQPGPMPGNTAPGQPGAVSASAKIQKKK